MYYVDFICLECAEDFEIDYWEPGTDVQCPNCKSVFETDCDYDYDGDISGPWLANKIEG